MNMYTKDNSFRNNKGSAILFSLALLFFSIIISILLGSVKIEIRELWGILRGVIPIEDPKAQILMNIRIPRSFMAVFVGANLATSGALLQAVMQNPLADPGVIGVSSGASLAAIAILILFPQWGQYVPIFAFAGAMIATFLVYSLAIQNRQVKPVRLILAGVAVNALFGGGNSLISVLNADKIQSVILWINGSLAGSSWNSLKIILPYSLVGLLVSLFCIRAANLMALGDEKAANLGLNISKARIVLSSVGAYLAGISTALVGVIGFVGLVIPHICRLLIGSDYRWMLPFSMINGASFLLLADTFARTVASPIELPVGTIMSVIGAPFFLYLLRKEGK